MKKKHGEFEKMISSVENPKRDFCGGSVMMHWAQQEGYRAKEVNSDTIKISKAG